MLNPGCPYVSNPSEAVDTLLRSRLVGQDAAVASVVEAIEDWHHHSTTGRRFPLVLALTGSTGVGKTETAATIGQAALKAQGPFADSGPLPPGMIEFRGEDFDDSTVPIHEYQERIKERLVRHVRDCKGTAVVLFEEAQKAEPKVLDVLKPALEAERAHMTHVIDGEEVTVDTSRVVFLIISDVGIDALMDTLVAADGGEVSMAALSTTLKRQLDAAFATLDIGGLVQKVVPYVPLSYSAMVDVITLRLNIMREAYMGKLWDNVEWTRRVSGYLSSKEFIECIYWPPDAPEGTKQARFARYGARDVYVSETGPIRTLQKKLIHVLKPVCKVGNCTVKLDVVGDARSPEFRVSTCKREPVFKEVCSGAAAGNGASDKEAAAAAAATAAAAAAGGAAGAGAGAAGAAAGTRVCERVVERYDDVCEIVWQGNLRDDVHHTIKGAKTRRVPHTTPAAPSGGGAAAAAGAGAAGAASAGAGAGADAAEVRAAVAPQTPKAPPSGKGSSGGEL